MKQSVALKGRNRTGPPYGVSRPTINAPRGWPARMPAALQTTTMTTDASQQDNTGPLGGPVIKISEAADNLLMAGWLQHRVASLPPAEHYLPAPGITSA